MRKCVREFGEDFFALFDRLEAAMRQALKQIGASEPVSDRGRDLSTFREMLMALHQYNLIDRSMLRDLMRIGRYRNLASYGRVRRVDMAMIDLTRAALARLEAPQSARRSPA